MALRRADGAAEVVVTNTGQGISPDRALPACLNLFRGDASHSQAVEGCGLGLSIARWITTAHSGTVRIASEPDRLTTVVVRLPLA